MLTEDANKNFFKRTHGIKLYTKKLSRCHKLWFSSPHIFAAQCSIWLQRYRDSKLLVCGKKSIPLTLFTLTSGFMPGSLGGGPSIFLLWYKSITKIKNQNSKICNKKIGKFAKVQIFIAKSRYYVKSVRKNAQIVTNYTFWKIPCAIVQSGSFCYRLSKEL